MKRPLFELKISEDLNDDLEVNYVAGVDSPAIEKNFFAFNQSTKPMNFAEIKQDERIVIGAAMIPNLKIFRLNEETGEEYDIFFSKETIEKIAVKFFEKDFQRNFNLMHDPTQTKDGVVFFQSFIKDTAKGVQGMAGDYPDGTWFLGAKINNDEVWQKIKDGEIKGWSVEGNFNLKPEKMNMEKALELIENILSDI
jgi:hypothetical protein